MADNYDQFLDAPDERDAFLDAPDTPALDVNAQSAARVKRQGATQEATQPNRSFLDELVRQVGLTARAGYTGIMSPATAASDALVSMYNLATGSNVVHPSQAQSQMLTKAGLPVPENAIERAAQVGAESMAGQAGLTKAAQLASANASPLLQNVAQQVAAAGASGAAAQPTAEYVQKVTGSPVASVVAALAVGSLAGKVAGKTTGKLVNEKAPPVTIDDIKQRAQRAYTSMEQMNVNARPSSVQNMINQTEANLNAANFNPQLDAHRPVAQLLNQFREMTGTARVPFTRLEQMRSAAVSMSRESNDAGTRRLAGIVVSNIDDYLSGLNSRDLMPGSQRGEDAVKAVLSARRDWKLQARSQIIEDVLDTATLRAENPRASEADLIRQGLTSLATNKNKMRQFSEEEQAAIREAIRSKGPDFMLNLLAKFNPERPGAVGTYALLGGLGTASTGSILPSAGAAGLATLGFSADKLYGFLKQRGAEKLASDILTGNLKQNPNYTMPGLFGTIPVKPEGQW